ncbi:macrophage colony-stimulating factor 1 receptor isoform X2 [Pyxicephalus adspersus]
MGTVALALLILASFTDGITSLVIEPPRTEIVIQEGEPLTLSCSGNGNVKWNLTKIQQKYFEPVDNTLQILKASYKNTGTYKCSSNTTEQASVHVFVTGAQLWNSLATIVRTDENDDTLLPCLITDPSLLLHTISLISLNGNRNPNASFDAKKGFTIHNTQMVDEGNYLCRAIVNGVTKDSSKIRLIVNEVPKEPPVVTLSSLTHIRIQGEFFQIKCTSVSSIRVSEIKWEHPGKNVNESVNYNIDGNTWTTISTLWISMVDFNDSGNYTCTGNFKEKSSRVSANLQVIEKGFVNISTPEKKKISLYVGQSVALTVFIEAYPNLLSWKWVHETSDNAMNIFSQGNLQFNDSYRSTSTMTLNRIQENEGGTYTFYAANSQANASLSFKITLYKPPKVVTIYPEFQRVTCKAWGTPLPYVSWVQCSDSRCADEEQEPLEGGETEVINENEVQSTLKLNEAQNFSNTTIFCLASNLAGNSSAQVHITSTILREVIGTQPTHQPFNPLLIVMAVVGVSLLLLSVFLFYKYKQKPKYEVHWQIVQVSEGNHYTCIDPTQLPYNEKWEFPRANLHFGKTLGAGAFGKVMEATAIGMGKDDFALKVAVKMLKPSAHADEKEALMSELKILSHLGHHQNIVNLLGACTCGGPILVITEYCPLGDLLNFLRRKAEAMNDMFTAYVTDSTGNYKNMSVEQKYVTSDSGFGNDGTSSYVDMRAATSNSKSTEGNSLVEEIEDDTDDHLPLDLHDLMNFSLQVAQGMSFLASKNCIHRDVAARNVLITQGRVVKICDFGLARDIENDSNYVVKGNARLPVKWMAPESIFDCIYTVLSDVWSYGILLWEIFSLGRSPYPGIIVNRKFYKMIKEGYKMDCPEYAPLDIYCLMKACWDLEPTKRPTFNQITDLINRQMCLIKDQEYANVIQGTQDEDCEDAKCMDAQQPLIKGNNYQFC